MKVKELLGKLSQFDGEVEVVVSGYEGGYESLDSVRNHKVQWGDRKHRSIYGEHLDFDDIMVDKEDAFVSVVYLGNGFIAE